MKCHIPCSRENPKKGTAQTSVLSDFHRFDFPDFRVSGVYNYKLSKNYNPLESDDLDCCAKCDLVMNLSLARLNSFKVGRRKWETPTTLPHDLRGIRVGVLYGLGMGHLIIHAESAI